MCFFAGIHKKFERKKTLGFLGNQPSFQCFLHGKQQKSSPIGELISHGDTSNSRPVHRTGQVPDWKLNKEFPVSIGKKNNKTIWHGAWPNLIFFRSGPPKLTRTGKVWRLLCTLVVKATMCFLPSGKPTALAGVTFETGHFWYFLPSRFAEKSTGTLQARIGERLPQTEKMIWFSRDFFEPSLNPLWMSTMSIATSHYQRVFNSLLSAAWDATVVSASAQVGDWFGFFSSPTNHHVYKGWPVIGGGWAVENPREVGWLPKALLPFDGQS